MTPAERVAASRAAQGLPPVVTDPGTLVRVAQLLVLASARREEADRAS